MVASADRRGGTPSRRGVQIWTSRTFSTGSGDSVGTCRAATQQPNRLGGDSAVLRTAEPHIADNRPKNWIRRRACGGQWSGRRTSYSGCNRPERSLCLSTLLGGSRSPPAASWERPRSPACLRPSDRPGGRSRSKRVPAPKTGLIFSVGSVEIIPPCPSFI